MLLQKLSFLIVSFYPLVCLKLTDRNLGLSISFVSSLEYMKTILNKENRAEILNRISSLNENNEPLWGKMNIYQMLKHCVLAEEMYLGKTRYKRTFLGLLLGKMMLKKMLKDGPMEKNAPTSAHFIIRETEGVADTEKQNWISLIKEYEFLPDYTLNHWFFGKMTKEQIGYFVYKHADHHLRQFNN